jgi:hypothetical protein
MTCKEFRASGCLKVREDDLQRHAILIDEMVGHLESCKRCRTWSEALSNAVPDGYLAAIIDSEEPALAEPGKDEVNTKVPSARQLAADIMRDPRSRDRLLRRVTRPERSPGPGTRRGKPRYTVN